MRIHDTALRGIGINSTPLSSSVSFADLLQQKTNGFPWMPAGKMIREKERMHEGGKNTAHQNIC